MKNKIHYCLLFVLLFPLFTFIPTQSVLSANLSPQENSINQCYSLDIVFIVDQSDSMSQNAWATDPTEQRKYAIQAAIDQLADNALDRCPNAVHRISIISFGTTTNVDLEYGEINPETIDEAIVIRNRLKADVKAYSLGQTLPFEAFVKAKEIFDTNLSLSTAPPSASHRKRVIIYITDGVPYPTIQGGAVDYIKNLGEYINSVFPFNSLLDKQENCLSILKDRYQNLDKAPQEEVNKCFSDYPVDVNELANSTYIFGLFMHSDAVYTPALNAAWGKIFLSHWGELIYLSNNRQEVSNSIRQILSRLIGVKLDVVNCGNIAVNPYLKRAIFTFFKIDQRLNVTLTYQDASGQVHKITSGQPGPNGGFDIGEYVPDGPNERYVFNKPYPGIWQLSADNCSGLDAYYDPIKVQPGQYKPNLPAEIPQYELPPYYDKNTPFYIEYQIRDIEGTVVPQADDPMFKVNIDVQIKQPDGQTVSYVMDYDPKSQTFRTTEPIKIPLPGLYYMDLVGTNLVHAGKVSVNSSNPTEIFTEKQVLFQEKGIEFRVHPVIPFKVNVIQPVANQNLGPIHGTIFDGWPLPVKSISVTANINPQTENTVQPNDIFDNPDSPLQASISAAGEASISSPLTIDSKDPWLYHGNLTNFTHSGPQTIKVRVVSGFNEYYRPLQPEIEVPIIREDGFWNKASTYWYILFFLVGVVGIWVLIWFFGLRNKLSGYLVVRMRGTPIRVIQLACGRNNVYLESRFWKQGLPSCISILKAYGIKNPNTKSKQTDEYESEWISGSIKVKGIAFCETEGKTKRQKFGREIVSGRDEQICVEHDCAIEYLDKNTDLPPEYRDKIEKITGFHINILPAFIFLMLVGIISWLMMHMLF
jgi:hypothetical protein